MVVLIGGSVSEPRGSAVAYDVFGVHSRASFCAWAIWAGVIRLASASRSTAPGFAPFAVPRVYHM